MIDACRTPRAVQEWLHELPYNQERDGETLRSFRGVVRHGEAHCLEAALAAAAILEQHGRRPRLLSFQSIDLLDHVIYPFQGRDGRWGAVARSRVWLLATAMLGLTFVGGQVYEFTVFVEEGLSLGTNMFGTTFYVLTGFHGAHVTVGILMLLTLVALSFGGRITPQRSETVELVGLYWHFVDIVWIAIFTIVYLIPTNPPAAGG